jgi:hypothetical protein
MKKIYLLTIILVSFMHKNYAQGQLSGDFTLQANFYDRDTTIGANTTQYLRELSSTESWLFLNYKISGFDFSVRYDAFHNSPLLNPQEAYTNHGIGFYSVQKSIENLEITGGYFYDQFGSGIIFRAYEDRVLGLDYALNGIRLKYSFNENFRMKAFTGQQKCRFETQEQVIKGFNSEMDFNLSDNFQLFTGAAVINRTLDRKTMDVIADNINADSLNYRFVPKYNVYALSFYNTLRYKNINLYTEYALKTEEAIKSKDGSRFLNKQGHVFYTSLNYSVRGLGLSLQHKRNETFSLRTSPLNDFLDGVINYMPPMAKQHSKTLPARYSISAQDYGEEAYQAELTLSPGKKNTFTLNASYVEDEENLKLFHEFYFEFYRKFNKKMNATFGIQNVYYNKLVYEDHLDTLKNGLKESPVVETLTPFMEIVYKMDRKKSLRSEIQYLLTEEDHGNFLFFLFEFSMAPHYSFSVSDMINTNPQKLTEIKHYPNITLVYTLKQSRFSLSYMKQVEGVVCTGGICRVEPAFSGVKFSLTTNF